MNFLYQEDLDAFCQDGECTSASGAMAACLQGLMADVLGAGQPDPTVAETMAELDKVPEALNRMCKCPYPPSEECMMGTDPQSIDSAADTDAVGDSGAGGEFAVLHAQQGFIPLLVQNHLRTRRSSILRVKHARGFQFVRDPICMLQLSSKCPRLFKLGGDSCLHA